MKQLLRLGDCYALCKQLLKYLKIQYISLLTAITIMCLEAVQQASAQEAEPAATATADIKPLQIGDTIPEYLWHMPLQVVNHPEGKDTITLNDSRGKLIILDFWATWCKPCLAAFPKLDSLQGTMPNDIAILLSTYEGSSSAVATLRDHRVALPSLVNQQALRAYFPHRLLPHAIWISPQNKLVAITDSRAITSQNIADMAIGLSIDVPVKIDRNLAYPLLLPEEYAGAVREYRVVVEGRLQGYGGETVFRHRADTLYGRAMTNRPVWQLYRAAVSELFKAEGQVLNPKQCVFLIRDSAAVFSMGADRRYFSVDIILPPQNAGNIYPELLALLNSALPYAGHIDRRQAKCLILEHRNGQPIAATETPGDSEHLIFTPLGLAQNLNKNAAFSPLPVIDAIGGSERIAVRRSDMHTPDELRNSLSKQGIALRETERELLFFTLTDK